MNTQNSELQQSLKLLQVEHKSLLQKNQNDLIRIRQQQALFKKSMKQIESQRAEWASKEAQFLLQIQDLTKTIEDLRNLQQTSSQQSNDKIKSSQEDYQKKTLELTSSFDKDQKELKSQILRLQQEHKSNVQYISALKEQIQKLQEQLQTSKNTVEILSRAYNLLQSESTLTIASLQSSIDNKQRLFQQNKQQLITKSQTSIEDEERIATLEQQLTLNKQLVKSLQTLLKVKEFEIERLTETR